ncbi:hypothetical protein FYJ24_11275 [Actinomycetaceae bacterium WB03_NA08]|uniref:Uncharacterized protein n=1 Tax=Scrofimicrobium canadense TaxID=2652290 RepID=A0A6N7W7G1_9ACTO|nr:hypothetical protein [Scrofimicrobium canadense]MSS85321.1 hypothetical protein [Scrofimicrobium canadense]
MTQTEPGKAPSTAVTAKVTEAGAGGGAGLAATGAQVTGIAALASVLLLAGLVLARKKQGAHAAKH